MSNRDPLLSPPDSDAALLARYQSAPTGETFRLLATRHLPLIWSTARRLVNGDAALAEDISQIVLTDFARKAPQLPSGTIAAGWLHRHTCFTAGKMVRTEIRRRAREQHAAEIHGDPDQNSAMTASAAAASSDPAWPEAAPFLDGALDQLSKSDRQALLLRFYQQQDHRSIGAALGFSEEAARKRITRALEKLRRLFRRRGIVLTAALLSQFLTDHATAATLPGAAWRQATASGPLTSASPLASIIRRFSLPAAAALLVLAGGVWAVAESGWFSSERAALVTVSSTAVPSAHKPAAEAPSLLLRYTIADLPAKFLAVRLLNYHHSPAADAALLAEARSLAPSGGKLEDFDVSAPLGRETVLEKTYPHDLPGRWVWDQEKDVGQVRDMETKDLGTLIGSTLRESEAGGFELTWQIRHHHAEPEAHAWPISLEKPTADPERSIKMEDFHHVGADGRSGNLKEDEPRLLFIQHLPPSFLPDAFPEPRSLLLFVTLNPS